MSNDSNRTIEQPSRRRVLKQAAVAGATLVVGPYFIGRAHAQSSDLAPYQQAKINWRQAGGRADYCRCHTSRLLRQSDECCT